MTSELTLLADARPGVPDPADVMPEDHRADLFARITGAHPSRDTADPQVVVELVPQRPGQREGRRRFPAAIAAAAAVVALGAGVVALTGTDRDGTPAGTGPESGPVDYTVPFSMRADSGWTVQRAQRGGGLGTTRPAELTVAWGKASYTIQRDPDNDIDVRGAKRVPVGDDQGYFGCVTSDPAPDWRDCKGGELAWRHDGHWMLIDWNHDVNVLLLVARAIDHSKPTRARVPFRTSAAPAGTTLVAWESGYRVSVTKGHPERATSWSFHAVYTHRNGHWIEINANPGTLASRTGEQRVTVDGRAAYWNPADHALRYDAGHGVQVRIVESNDDSGPHVLSRSDAIALAEASEVVSTPSERGSWYRIEDALPAQ